jgi:L-fuconolactonase
MRIDSHHHLWQFVPEEHTWIGDDMAPLRRDYLGQHLMTEMRGAGIDAAVAVQARQSLAENDFLLAQAEACPAIAGVVGWVDLQADDVDDVLDRYAAHPRFVGVRHVVQSEPDGFLQGAAFNRGVALLARRTLVYDVLIVGRQLPEAITFVDRHPNQPFVLDHIAKPTIVAGRFDEAWARAICELARRPHVTCKLSGIVTEVREPMLTRDLIRPYVDVALEAFGPSRLLFGSDWPVCRLRVEYGEWVRSVEALIVSLSPHERTAVFGGNAAKVYGLDGHVVDGHREG